MISLKYNLTLDTSALERALPVIAGGLEEGVITEPQAFALMVESLDKAEPVIAESADA